MERQRRSVAKRMDGRKRLRALFVVEFVVILASVAIAYFTHWRMPLSPWIAVPAGTALWACGFFYTLHLFLYLVLGRWLTPVGASITVMYLFWLAGLLILYPLCMWYGRFKSQQPASSILRFL